MKLIETKNAVGHVLCHDLTRIVPGEFKGAQFRKGHIVTEDDIPVLLSMGKEHLYVWEMTPGMLHENDDDAARLVAEEPAAETPAAEEPAAEEPAAEEPAAEEPAEEPVTLIVFAAASMTETLTEFGNMYTEQHPNVTIQFNFDSSGTRKTQIEEGADCDVFISAGQKQLRRQRQGSHHAGL